MKLTQIITSITRLTNDLQSWFAPVRPEFAKQHAYNPSTASYHKPDRSKERSRF